jgi:hypothetical protein
MWTRLGRLRSQLPALRSRMRRAPRRAAAPALARALLLGALLAALLARGAAQNYARVRRAGSGRAAGAARRGSRARAPQGKAKRYAKGGRFDALVRAARGRARGCAGDAAPADAALRARLPLRDRTRRRRRGAPPATRPCASAWPAAPAATRHAKTPNPSRLRSRARTRAWPRPRRQGGPCLASSMDLDNCVMRCAPSPPARRASLPRSPRRAGAFLPPPSRPLGAPFACAAACRPAATTASTATTRCAAPPHPRQPCHAPAALLRARVADNTPRAVRCCAAAAACAAGGG